MISFEADRPVAVVEQTHELEEILQERLEYLRARRGDTASSKTA